MCSPGSGCRGTSTLHVLATPSELPHRPLLQQAMVAVVVACIAVVGQRGCSHWARWSRGRTLASFVSCSATILFLADWPSLCPIGEPCIAIVRARGRDGLNHWWRNGCWRWLNGLNHRRRWRRPENWRRRRCWWTTNVVVHAAPYFLTLLPLHWASHGTIRIRRWRWRSWWRARCWCWWPWCWRHIRRSCGHWWCWCWNGHRCHGCRHWFRAQLRKQVQQKRHQQQ